MTIAVTGASGQLGQLVIKSLLEKAEAKDVLALARSPEKAEGLGVNVRYFDYTVPEELPIALEGVETLLLISSSEVGERTQQHKNVIEAAKKAEVKRLVYTSLLHADTSAITALAEEHVETEALIKESGLDYVILRNGWYNGNYAGSVPVAVANDSLIGSAGDGKISSAARKDYAEAATVILTTEKPEKQVYELAGDASYTLTELAAEISKQTGKEIPYINLPEAEYASKLVEAGLDEGLAKAIASFDIGASKGALYSDDKSLSKLIGRPTTPIANCVAAALKS